MILNYEIDTNIEIQKLTDLKVLKNLMDTTNLKVNKSRLARELNVDRRTIGKYINGYEKPKNRDRLSVIDEYYDLIKELLNNKIKVFEYKKVLWQYLCDNYGLKCAESSFRRYISLTPEFQEYFDKKKKSAIKMVCFFVLSITIFSYNVLGDLNEKHKICIYKDKKP